jgi:hypothetical protein
MFADTVMTSLVKGYIHDQILYPHINFLSQPTQKRDVKPRQKRDGKPTQNPFILRPEIESIRYNIKAEIHFTYLISSAC